MPFSLRNQNRCYLQTLSRTPWSTYVLNFKVKAHKKILNFDTLRSRSVTKGSFLFKRKYNSNTEIQYREFVRTIQNKDLLTQSWSNMSNHNLYCNVLQDFVVMVMKPLVCIKCLGIFMNILQMLRDSNRQCSIFADNELQKRGPLSLGLKKNT